MGHAVRPTNTPEATGAWRDPAAQPTIVDFIKEL